MKQEKLVSIITPAYNASKFIGIAIDSILKQTYKNWEMLIIDDCSVDNTNKLVSSYVEKNPRIKLISLDKNGGVANARNCGLRTAEGIYIAFLDSDDLWHPEKLEKQINLMERENVAITFTAYQKINEFGNTISKKINVPREVDYHQLLLHNVIPCSSAIFLRRVLKNLQFTKIGHEDFVFWLSALKLIKFARGINEVLMYYRVQSNSISANKINAAKYTWNILKNIEKLDFFKALYYFSNYAIRSFTKYLK